MPVFRKLLCQQEMLRELYENWLILVVGMIVGWNHLRLLDELPPSNLVVAPMPSPLVALPPPAGCNQRLAEMFFVCGLLGFMLPFRCHWVRRCRHPVQLLLLFAEVPLLIGIVEFNARMVWHPFLGIYQDMFQLWGQRDYVIYHYAPGLAKWLADGGAYEAFLLVLSFAFFVGGMSAAAENWIKTVDLLLLGYGPENPGNWVLECEVQSPGRRHRRYAIRPAEPTPDRLMYRRLCSACLHEARLAFEREVLGQNHNLG